MALAISERRHERRDIIALRDRRREIADLGLDIRQRARQTIPLSGLRFRGVEPSLSRCS